MKLKFQNQLLKAYGTQFQDLFYRLMNEKYDDFIPVKPHGRYGDSGCDGYLANHGEYFQIYGPEVPKNSIDCACSKIKKDFEKLYNLINDENNYYPAIKVFSFVFNNKTDEIISMKLSNTINQLRAENKTIKFSIWDTQKLEKLFAELEFSQQERVLSDYSFEDDNINIRIFQSKIKAQDLMHDINKIRKYRQDCRKLMGAIENNNFIQPFKEDIFDLIENFKEDILDTDFRCKVMVQIREKVLIYVNDLSKLLGYYSIDIGNGFFRMKRIEPKGEIVNENFKDVSDKVFNARNNAYCLLSEFLDQETYLNNALSDIPGVEVEGI